MDKETSERLKKLEIDAGIDKGIHQWVRTVCITATSTFMGFCIWLGGQIYDKFDQIKAGIMAFLIAGRHGQ